MGNDRPRQLHPTWCGYISSKEDALLVFEACFLGRLSYVGRRMRVEEQPLLVRSGNIFVFKESPSTLRRWTDYISWSASRISGDFLVYREREPSAKLGEKPKRSLLKRSNSIPHHSPESQLFQITETENACEFEKSLFGSFKDSSNFRRGGLVKKTISIDFPNARHRLVSYYSVDDVMSNVLRTPLSSPTVSGDMHGNSMHILKTVFEQAYGIQLESWLCSQFHNSTPVSNCQQSVAGDRAEGLQSSNQAFGDNGPLLVPQGSDNLSPTDYLVSPLAQQIWEPFVLSCSCSGFFKESQLSPLPPQAVAPQEAKTALAYQFFAGTGQDYLGTAVPY